MRIPAIAWVVVALATLGWSPKTELAVARRGALLGPPDLARQIRKHTKPFSEGLRAPIEEDGAAAFRADVAEKNAREVADGIVRMLDERTPFQDVVFELGRLAHYVMVAGDPVAASRDPRVGTYAADYARYAEVLYERLPRVYYGIRPAALRGEVAPIVREARHRAGRLSGFIGEEYYRGGSLRSSEDFDDLAVTFGVASIALSHSASDVASAFTAVWTRANGDTRPVQVAAASPGWRLAPSPSVTQPVEDRRRKMVR